MELMFAQRLRKYRRERDLTQEQLAAAIDISPQSVSKWERGDGYPDITLLPRIANYFGVSIDFLLGNDALTREEDLQNFFRIIREELPNDADDERLRIGKEYAEKYPESDDVAHELCWIIYWHDHREEHIPLLKEMCEKLIRESTCQTYRENAIAMMCKVCDDEEFPRWYAMCAQGYDACKGEILEQRLLEKQRWEECVVRKGVNKLEMFCHLMESNCGNWNDPGRSREWSRYRMQLMESFGESGEIPPAWEAWYAMNCAYAADSCFALHRDEEGYTLLEEAAARLEQWIAVPDGTALDVGHHWLFHGVKVIKGKWNLLLPDGSREYSNGLSIFCSQKDFLRAWLTHRRERCGFDRVRGEERFAALVERAERMKN